MTGFASIRMIATDIDGTMLWTDGTLSRRTKAALHDARAAGIEVVPATGRPNVVALDVIEALEMNDHWVFANGAITRHIGRDETLRAHWIDPWVAQGLVIELRDELPGAGFAMEFATDIAYEPGFEDQVPNKPTIPPVADVLDAMTQRVQKVLVFHPELTIDELYTAVDVALDGHGVVSYSGLGFVEVAARLVTKAVALDALCRDLGIEPADVAAFGDNHNDVAMLEWAGHGFAMANASDDAKVAADRVIGHTDNDALAEVVEEIVRQVGAQRSS